MTFIDNNNAKIGKGVKWKVKTTLVAPTWQGKMGEIYVLSSNPNFKKIKKLINADASVTTFENNAITLFKNDTQPLVRFNIINGWNFEGKFGTGTQVMLDGESIYATVYIWDEISQSWKRFDSTMMEIFSIGNFAGNNINIDAIWQGLTYTEECNPVLPTIVAEQLEDEVDIDDFSASSLNLDNIWQGFIYTENIESNKELF